MSFLLTYEPIKLNYLNPITQCLMMHVSRKYDGIGLCSSTIIKKYIYQYYRVFSQTNIDMYVYYFKTYISYPLNICTFAYFYLWYYIQIRVP